MDTSILSLPKSKGFHESCSKMCVHPIRWTFYSCWVRRKTRQSKIGERWSTQAKTQQRGSNDNIIHFDALKNNACLKYQKLLNIPRSNLSQQISGLLLLTTGDRKPWRRCLNSNQRKTVGQTCNLSQKRRHDSILYSVIESVFQTNCLEKTNAILCIRLVCFLLSCLAFRLKRHFRKNSHFALNPVTAWRKVVTYLLTIFFVCWKLG